MTAHSIPLIEPDWPAPDSVHCVVTTRQGGSSGECYSSLNLALHVGDQPDVVKTNRATLQDSFPEIKSWQWLEQTHSADVHRIETAKANRVGDGLVTRATGLACCIMTADCLPILICNEAGTEVAAIHGGWRGLAKGIIDNTIAELDSDPGSLLVWFGPAIGPCHFEVGAEVRTQFVEGIQGDEMSRQFVPQENGKYLADLYGIARVQLQGLGVQHFYGGGFCTYSDEERFYSYRRDGRCGRMVSAIYLG